MKTILFTASDDTFRPLAELTVPRMALYANRHGMDFLCYRQPLLNVPFGIYWTGVTGALRAINNGYDRAIYLDADQMVTNFDFVIPDFVDGFHVSKDWGLDAVHEWDFSACGFVAHQDSKLFLEHTIDLEPGWREKPFPEQGPMRWTAEHLAVNVKVHERRLFNAVPEEVCPGRLPDPWQLGDWCAHLTMVPLETRVAIFYKIASCL